MGQTNTALSIPHDAVNTTGDIRKSPRCMPSLIEGLVLHFPFDDTGLQDATAGPPGAAFWSPVSSKGKWRMRPSVSDGIHGGEIRNSPMTFSASAGNKTVLFDELVYKSGLHTQSTMLSAMEVRVVLPAAHWRQATLFCVNEPIGHT